MKINFKYNGDFLPPKKHSKDAAGIDLFNNGESFILKPNESKIIPTGFSVEIPIGYFGMVVGRSSLGFKLDCILSNSVGIIDSDYRGEIGLKIKNLSNEILEFESAQRLAQLIIVPHGIVEYIEVDKLNETERGVNGFGSTGK